MSALALYVLITALPGPSAAKTMTVSMPVTQEQCVAMQQAVVAQFKDWDYWVEPKTACRKLGTNQGDMPEL